MSEMISPKDKQRAIKMAYSIIGDKRNVNRYCATTITSKTDPSLMFTYSDMIHVLESMYAELEEAQDMQKPLTHKEAEDLLQTGARVWTEERVYCEEPEGVNGGYLETEGYGTRWRCWASEPTNEERAAAPWED